MLVDYVTLPKAVVMSYVSGHVTSSRCARVSASMTDGNANAQLRNA